MAQDQDRDDLAAINGAIVRLIEKLENQDLAADGRQLLEKELLALVDTRLEIEEKANQSCRSERRGRMH